MSDKRLRVFLDTSVLLAALRGVPGASALFRPEPEEAASYVVSPVVTQELLLSSENPEIKAHVDELIRHVEVLGAEAPVIPDLLTDIRKVRNQSVHTNDLLILGDARNCDRLLTYDKSLIILGPAVGVAASTPEAFLAELGVEP